MSETAAKAKVAAKRSVSPVPRHANAEAHAKLMGWLKSASKEAILDLSKRAGVYNADGTLSRHYKSGK